MLNKSGTLQLKRPVDCRGGVGSVGGELGAFRRSFVYVSDYISLPGLRIWQEELSRIFHFCLEREVVALGTKSSSSSSPFRFCFPEEVDVGMTKGAA